jgi:hypothetical protein
MGVAVHLSARESAGHGHRVVGWSGIETLLAALSVLLDRRARHRAVRTEHATVVCERLEPRSAALAVIEKLASVGWHRLGRLMTAIRTGDR